MAVAKNEFLVLRELKSAHEIISQRRLSQLTGLSLGSVNAALKSCENAGYVADGLLTQAGIEALAPYKVNNAIIMAAGLS